MPDQPKPNVAGSLLITHQIITRAIATAKENAQIFADQGFPDQSTLDGFTKYTRALTSFLNGHHLIEDDIAFPYFADKLTEAPFELLVEQHYAMLALLDQINQAVEKCQQSSQQPQGLAELNQALAELEEMWFPHIQIEEQYFTPQKLDQLLPLEEHLRLIKLFSEYSQKHTDPASLIIPFMLYNLPPDTRATMAQGLPLEITQNLVPKVWKAEWEPMKPFLLD
jgi:hemerythrin-like domain-containing protein